MCVPLSSQYILCPSDLSRLLYNNNNTVFSSFNIPKRTPRRRRSMPSLSPRVHLGKTTASARRPVRHVCVFYYIIVHCFSFFFFVCVCPFCLILRYCYNIMVYTVYFQTPRWPLKHIQYYTYTYTYNIRYYISA